MLYKLINKYYKLYINAKQVLIFLYGIELLPNKTYSKEIGLTTKLESYIQYVVIFNKVFQSISYEYRRGSGNDLQERPERDNREEGRKEDYQDRNMKQQK